MTTDGFGSLSTIIQKIKLISVKETRTQLILHRAKGAIGKRGQESTNQRWNTHKALFYYLNYNIKSLTEKASNQMWFLKHVIYFHNLEVDWALGSMRQILIKALPSLLNLVLSFTKIGLDCLVSWLVGREWLCSDWPFNVNRGRDYLNQLVLLAW